MKEIFDKRYPVTSFFSPSDWLCISTDADYYGYQL